ncbi:MAG: quinone oxidoreductase [Bryobacterales bacterium]|nr:quinone oxidoreductase [Bryobacterales bacterium]
MPTETQAIVIRECGGPEVLAVDGFTLPDLGKGEVLVRVAAAGVNFIDVYHRTGLYKVPPPFVPGMEGAGIVEAAGPEVTEVVPGDHVAWAMVRGSYAAHAIVPAANLVHVPAGIGLDTAAAAMLQGMTAHYLTHSTYSLKSGDTCLVHAAAGGTGLLIVQMAKARGARVFGTVSTEAKAELARAAGADETILYTSQDFEAEVKRLTGGAGLDVVYDSVGLSTFEKSLNCLRPRGMMVLFGQSSGPVPPFDPGALAAKGSLFLTRPTLAHYGNRREELVWRSSDVLEAIASGSLKVKIERSYALADAAEAHRDLQGRGTSGKLLLRPPG